MYLDVTQHPFGLSQKTPSKLHYVLHALLAAVSLTVSPTDSAFVGGCQAVPAAHSTIPTRRQLLFYSYLLLLSSLQWHLRPPSSHPAVSPAHFRCAMLSALHCSHAL